MTADGPVDLVRQGELQQQIATDLYQAFSDVAWSFLDAYFTQAGEFVAGVVELTDEEGRVGSQPFPATVLPQLVGLRYEMWNPLTLPWYHVQVTGNTAGEFRFFFNHERRFDLNRRPLDRYSLTGSPLPTDADLVEDLTWFPRSEEHIPDWYPRA